MLRGRALRCRRWAHLQLAYGLRHRQLHRRSLLLCAFVRRRQLHAVLGRPWRDGWDVPTTRRRFANPDVYQRIRMLEWQVLFKTRGGLLKQQRMRERPLCRRSVLRDRV